MGVEDAATVEIAEVVDEVKDEGDARDEIAMTAHLNKKTLNPAKIRAQ